MNFTKPFPVPFISTFVRTSSSSHTPTTGIQTVLSHLSRPLPTSNNPSRPGLWRIRWKPLVILLVGYPNPVQVIETPGPAITVHRADQPVAVELPSGTLAGPDWLSHLIRLEQSLESRAPDQEESQPPIGS